MAGFSSRKFHSYIGQLVTIVVLGVIFWPVKLAHCGSCDPLPNLVRHFASSLGPAGRACSLLSVKAASFRMKGVDACSLG